MENEITAGLLAALQSQDITLANRDGCLYIRIPRTMVSSGLITRIHRNQSELLQLIDPMPSDRHAVTGIHPGPRQSHYPLSATQTRLYVIYQMAKHTTAYNLPFLLELHGRIEIPLIRQVLQYLIARHEPLRTSFGIIDGNPIQQIHDNVSLPLEYAEIDGVSGQEIPDIDAYVTPFALHLPPLFRARLIQFRTPEKVRHFLFCDMHHIISDGISLGVLVRDINLLLKGQSLPSLPVQYKDYTLWHNKLLQSPFITGQKEYWLNRFRDGAPVLRLPADMPRPPLFTYRSGSVSFSLDSKTAGALNKMAREMHISLFMVLIAVYAVLLYRHSNQDTIVIATPIAGRRFPGLENLVGFFVNMLPIRFTLQPSLTFIGFLKETAQDIFRDFEHQDYPYEKLINALNPERDLSRNSLMDAVFSMRNFGIEDIKTDDMEISVHHYQQTQTQSDITLIAIETSAGIDFVFEYYSDIFTVSTIQRLRDHFLELIRAILEEPDTPLGRLNLLPEAEKHSLLYGFRHPSPAFPDIGNIYTLFADQAGNHPDNIALIYKGREFSYREVEEQALRLGSHLRESGVGPGKVTAIIGERSPGLIAGILGILKAGGICLPIDPRLPAESIRVILGENRAALLLIPDVYNVKIDFKGKIININAFLTQ